MSKKISTNAKKGLEQTRDALIVKRRLSNAILEEKKRLGEEGYALPSTSLYVEGDTRITWQPEKYFNKSYKRLVEEIKEECGLSMTELGIIYCLSLYIGYEDNLLSNRDGTPLLKKDLTEILGMAHNAVDKYINSLVSEGLLAKVKVKRAVNYYLNPRIAYQGNRIDKTLLNMFNIKI